MKRVDELQQAVIDEANKIPGMEEYTRQKVALFEEYNSALKIEDTKKREDAIKDIDLREQMLDDEFFAKSKKRAS